MNVHDKEADKTDEKADFADRADKAEKPAQGGFMGKMRELVKKAIDCCIE